MSDISGVRVRHCGNCFRGWVSINIIRRPGSSVLSRAFQSQNKSTPVYRENATFSFSFDKLTRFICSQGNGIFGLTEKFSSSQISFPRNQRAKKKRAEN